MKISLVINTYCFEGDEIQKAVNSATGFDEVLIYINHNPPYPLPRFNKEVKVYYGTGRTAAQGFNYIISKALNEWICPFCDDDFFITDKCSELLTTLKTDTELPNKDVIYYPCLVNGSKSVRLGTPNITLEDIKKGNLLPFSCIYRKKVWEEVGGYREVPFNDWFFWMCVIKKGFKLAHYDIPIYNFRVVKDSLSNKELKAAPYEETRQLLLKELEKMS